MKHLSELECSFMADREEIDRQPDSAMASNVAERPGSHLRGCETCQEMVAAYHKEKGLIAAALQVEDLALIPDMVVPRFTKPIGLREFALANVITGAVLWLAQFLWKTLFGEFIMSALSWFSLPVPDTYEVLVDIALYFSLYFSLEGGSMFDSWLICIFLALFIVVGWSAYSYRKARGLELFSVMVLLGFVTLMPTPVSALELRHDENMVNIVVTEVINDTLLVASDTIIVDADINGDLIALGRRVVVNGDVSGNLVTFGRMISVHGTIGGTMVTAGDSIDLIAAQIEGDFWAAAENVNVDGESRILRNTMMAGEMVVVAGDVGKDLYSAAETTELSGRVGADLEAFTEWLKLVGDARVEGDLRLHTHNEEALQQSASAIVVGKIEYPGLPDDFEPENRYVTGEFYLHQALRLASAFLVGIILFWLIPVFRTAQVEGGIDGIATAGIGLVALISMPFIGLLLAITVVGLPLTVIGFFAWVLLIYFAKIVLAPIVGRMMLSHSDRRDSVPLTLFAGLFALMLVINLPAVGSVFNFLLTVVGTGVIVRLIMGYVTALRERSY